MTTPIQWMLRLGMLATLAGCAHYEPKPLSAERSAAAWQARSLGDDGLRVFIETNLGPRLANWPTPVWDLRLLTLAAFYYHPDLDVARAKWGVARAGVVTAGERPNPGVSFTANYVTPTTAGANPWILQPGFSIPIETFGKRGYRLQEAKRLSEVSQLEFAGTAWQIRSGVRSAIVDWLLTRNEVEVLAAEERIRAELVSIMETRARLGDVPRQLAASARIDLTRVRQQRIESEGRWEQARASLAQSVGVPATALADIEVSYGPLESPPIDPALTSEAQREALLNRLDLRRGLVAYAAAESALQREIARQYPDLQLGPGYRWRETEERWQLGLSLTLPLLNQNQGGIAAAQARRELAAAEFERLQAAALGEVQRALAGYQSAHRSLETASHSLSAASAAENEAQQAFNLGDVDAGTLAAARLVTATARRERLATLRSVHAALGALEDAVQKPLGDPFGFAAPPEISPRPAQPRAETQTK